MATVTKGKTFGTTEEVTAAKLHQLVDSATVTGIVNADIDASADIASSKLADKTGSDTDLVTGTAGTDGNLIKWNADGDAVDSTFGVLDENDLSSDSDTDLPTQQSVKAYVDGGGNGSIAGPTGVTVATCGTALIAGGLVMKYGSGSSTLDTSESFSFDSAFPNNCFIVLIAGASAHLSADSFSASGFTINRNDSIDGDRGFRFIAIGN